jgi:hypothetical protein
MKEKQAYQLVPLFDLDTGESALAFTNKKKRAHKTKTITGFDTPTPICRLIADLMQPQPGSTIYDPACRSGALLLQMRKFFQVRYPNEKVNLPDLYGEEINSILCDWAQSNMSKNKNYKVRIIRNDALYKPGFVENTGNLQRFDYVVSSPQWNQRDYRRQVYQGDTQRFIYGIPPKSSADWGWIQHVLASLKDEGRAAVVFDRGVLSRGSNSGERNNGELLIRSQFVEKDKIESVVLLPYDKTRPCVLLTLSHNKPIGCEGQILFIDASKYFIEKGKQWILTQEGIQTIDELYHQWKIQKGISRTVILEEIRRANYNLDPRIYIEKEEGQKMAKSASQAADIASKVSAIQSIFSHGMRGEERKDTPLGLLPISWEVRTLSDIATDISGGNRHTTTDDTNRTEIPWVQISDLNNDVVKSTQKVSTYSKSQRIPDKIRTENTVMIAKSRSAGKLGILGMQATTNHAICCIKPRSEIIDPLFLFYYLLSLRNNWSKFASGTYEGSQLTHDIIKAVHVPLPSLMEQLEIVQKLKELNEALE